MQGASFILRVLFFKDHTGDWNAQALERDIAASGSDQDLAKQAFERTIAGYIQAALAHKQEPLSSLKPAPDVFWQAWERASTSLMTLERIPTLPAYVIRAVTYDEISA